MTLLQKLITPLADGTAITSGNSGGGTVSATGGSTITWQGGKAVFSGVNTTPCQIRYNFNASNNTMQFSGRWETPTTDPTAVLAFLSFRHTATGRAWSLNYTATRGLALYDTVNTITVVLASGTLSAASEYFIQIQSTGGSTTASTADIKVFPAAGGAQIGTTYSLTNGNFTVNQYSQLDLGASALGSTTLFKWRYAQFNDGSGSYIADYIATTPLDTPVVTISGFTNPTTVGGTDGSISITWSAITGAHHYEVDVKAGSVTTGFTTGNSGTSPWTFTGLGAGPYTVAVRAKAS